ncbi:MAG: hypothetical protein LBH03_05810 [Holophagales bacterium]|jgi:hypothetical protein|nr:hypothetical protein [Holophagales bacterium]
MSKKHKATVNMTTQKPALQHAGQASNVTSSSNNQNSRDFSEYITNQVDRNLAIFYKPIRPKN